MGQDILFLQHAERVEFVSDALGGKATSTLGKRIGQLVSYFRWCDKEGFEYFPVTREKSRGYIGDARQGHGAAGRVSGFIECLTFLHHVLGFDVDLSDLADPWLKGVQRQLQASRPPRRQARPLTCREVLILEEALANPSLVVQDRMACGVMLFAIYSRARASDLSSLCSLEIDPGDEPGTGYIEAATFKHKSRQTGNSTGLPLLLIAPMKGLGSRSWGADFVQVFEASGLPLSRFADGEGPLLPAPSPDNRCGSRGVTSSELGGWMCSILASPDALKPTSHSLKATMLSILVKWGCNPDTVLILGHQDSVWFIRTAGMCRRPLFESWSGACPTSEPAVFGLTVRDPGWSRDLLQLRLSVPACPRPCTLATSAPSRYPVWHQRPFVKSHLRHRTRPQAPRSLHQTRSTSLGDHQGHTLFGERGVLSIGTNGPRRCTCFRLGVRLSCVVASVLMIMLCTVAPSSRLLRSASSARPAVPSGRQRD